MRHSQDDEDLICRTVVAKLTGLRGISFEEIARTAYDEGRGRLATQLLNHEPRAGRQVPLLLSMAEDEIALDKAIESGDTDLVFYVLLLLKKKLPLAAFFRLINDRPVAASLIEASARETDPELLKDFYYADDRRSDGAHVVLRDALAQKELAAKIEKTKLAAKLLADSKEHALESRSLDESARLLQMQEVFEKDLAGERFAGESVNETVFRLIRMGYNSRANKVKSEFKIPEKRFWWLKLRALVAKRDWGEIEEWGRTKKSPIGWEVCLSPFFLSFLLLLEISRILTTECTTQQPFFNECLSAGNTKAAANFIPKCTNLAPADRMDMWVRCGLVVKAGEEAFRAKDVNALEVLRTKATGVHALEIERLLKQLRPGK